MLPAQLRKFKRGNEFAFTIIELLAVMAVIGILTTIVVGGYRQTQRRGRDAQRKSDLKQMSQSLEVYLSDHGTYPPSSVNGKIMGCPAETTECEWGTGQFSDSTGNIYFVNLPDDPLSSQDYFYRAFDNNRKYQIFAWLENPKDQDCFYGECATDPAYLPAGVACGSVSCNYAVYSPNVRLVETYSQPTPTPTPTFTPTPTPTLTPTPTPTFTPTPTPTPSGPSWWNASYQYRRNITITGNSDTASSPLETVRIRTGTSSLVSAGKMQPDGDDLRTLYWNGAFWVETGRQFHEMNSSQTDIWFGLQATIGNGSTDNNYYIYYGNSAASSPPTGLGSTTTKEFYPGDGNSSFKDSGAVWNSPAATGDFSATSNKSDQEPGSTISPEHVVMGFLAWTNFFGSSSWQVPTGARIVEDGTSSGSRIRLWGAGNTGSRVRANALVDSWSENNTNWNYRNAGSSTSWSGGSGAGAQITSGEITGWNGSSVEGTVAADMPSGGDWGSAGVEGPTFPFLAGSATIQRWVTSKLGNNGLVVWMKAGLGNGVEWYSEEFGTATQRPRLTFVYYQHYQPEPSNSLGVEQSQ